MCVRTDCASETETDAASTPSVSRRRNMSYLQPGLGCGGEGGRGGEGEGEAEGEVRAPQHAVCTSPAVDACGERGWAVRTHTQCMHVACGMYHVACGVCMCMCGAHVASFMLLKGMMPATVAGSP